MTMKHWEDDRALRVVVVDRTGKVPGADDTECRQELIDMLEWIEGYDVKRHMQVLEAVPSPGPTPAGEWAAGARADTLYAQCPNNPDTPPDTPAGWGPYQAILLEDPDLILIAPSPASPEGPASNSAEADASERLLAEALARDVRIYDMASRSNCTLDEQHAEITNLVGEIIQDPSGRIDGAPPNQADGWNTPVVRSSIAERPPPPALTDPPHDTAPEKPAGEPAPPTEPITTGMPAPTRPPTPGTGAAARSTETGPRR